MDKKLDDKSILDVADNSNGNPTNNGDTCGTSTNQNGVNFVDESLSSTVVDSSDNTVPSNGTFDDDDDEQIVESPIQKKGLKKSTTQKVVLFAIFLAFVILFQFVGGFIKIGTTSISLVLIPIVLGGVLLGPIAGLLLGFAFGVVTLIAGASGIDPFTMLLIAEQPALTVLTCLVKGSLAGLIPALIYKPIAKKHPLVGVVVASALAPIVNTGLFILGALTMSGTLQANFVEEGMSVIYFLVIVCAGINFLVELAVNLVASPAIHSLIRIYNKNHKR